MYVNTIVADNGDAFASYLSMQQLVDTISDQDNTLVNYDSTVVLTKKMLIL